MFNIGSQRIGIFRQTKTTNHWNNPASATANFKTLLYEAGIAPEYEFNVNNMALTSQIGTMQNLSRTVLDYNLSGLKRLSFSGPATYDTLHFHLAAAMQSVVQASTFPFRKTFTMASHSGMLDVASNQGHLFTLAGNQQAGTTQGWTLWNAVLDELVITIEKDAQNTNRMMRLSGTWVGTRMPVGVNLAGNWQPTPIRYNLVGDYSTSQEEFILEGMIGDYGLEWNRLPWKKFELRINNNISVPTRTTNGEALNYVFSPEVRFSVQFINNSHFNSFFHSMFGYFNNTNIATSNLIVKNQYAQNVQNEVLIELDNIYPDANFFATENNYFIINFSGKATSSSTEGPLTIILSDGQNAGY